MEGRAQEYLDNARTQAVIVVDYLVESNHALSHEVKEGQQTSRAKAKQSRTRGHATKVVRLNGQSLAPMARMENCLRQHRETLLVRNTMIHSSVSASESGPQKCLLCGGHGCGGRALLLGRRTWLRSQIFRADPHIARVCFFFGSDIPRPGWDRETGPA